MKDEQPRKRPTEIALELVERFVDNPAGEPLQIPGGLRWVLKIQIADAIRRERVVIFKLRDAANAVVSLLPEDSANVALLREAVEASLTDEDLNLPRFNAPSFLHVPSSRIACLDVRELTPGRLTFEFEDSYTGKGFALTFDAGSEILCGATLEGASAEQLGAMVAFALNDLQLRREKTEVTLDTFAPGREFGVREFEDEDEGRL